MLVVLLVLVALGVLVFFLVVVTLGLSGSALNIPLKDH